MAFPTTSVTAETSGSTAASPAVCNLPFNAAGFFSGQSIFVLILRTAAGATHTTPSGWVDIVKNDTSDASDDCTSIFAQSAPSSPPSTVSVTLSASNKFAAASFSVNGAALVEEHPPDVSTVAIGTTATPDPGNCVPAGDGGANEFLWLWIGAWDGEQTNPPAGSPTNYTALNSAANSGTGGATATNCQIATAFRTTGLYANSENPGSWTISASPTGWSAWTMAIRPYKPKQGSAFQDPAVSLMKADAESWLRRRSGIFVPKLWTPEPEYAI